jgi:uncharacterized protein (TIGR00730 family)
LGRRIADAGWVLLNGGYGGTMEAAAKGARERGGHVIGVTVRTFRKDPNAYTSEAFLTADLWERIRTMLHRSDAFIALPGSTGTLAEVGMAWEFIYEEFMPPRPLIFLGEFWRPMYDTFVTSADPSASCGGLVRVEKTPAAAVAYLKAHWSAPG